MKYIKSYESVQISDIEIKNYIIVEYKSSTKFRFVIFKVIDKPLPNKKLTVQKLLTYNSEQEKFKRHTQDKFVTSLYVFGTQIIYSSDSLQDCKEIIPLIINTNKYNL